MAQMACHMTSDTLGRSILYSILRAQRAEVSHLTMRRRFTIHSLESAIRLYDRMVKATRTFFVY
jgi:hypothetical protein